MSVKVIEAKNVSVQYRGIEALCRISFDVQSGDYIGIVGPNGSGKTTLVKALLGLVSFDGRIRFQGESLSDFTTTKHIGYLPQKMSFLDQRFPATAEEIVVSGVYCCKRFPKRLSQGDYKAALEAMEILGITNLKNRPIGRLSGGQQQRILLARALVHHPQLLILDEPTVALDPQSRESFYATVKKLNKENGVTVLLVSHDIGSIGQYASKLLYLDREIIFYGTFEEFCKSPKMSDYFGAGQHMICHRH
ncbi:MAG: metal ABC transporter ATP-binding protein [Candidatus Omnitrophota bacterium]